MLIDSVSLWLAPMILLPGVALLVVSTSARYAQIHDEIHHIQMSDTAPELEMSGHLLTRALMFRNALVSLYFSVALFLLASLFGGLTSVFRGWESVSNTIVLVILGFGILFLVFASIELVRESILSVDIIRQHHEEIETKFKSM